MKRNVYSDDLHEIVIICILPIIFGEMIFHKVYLDPLKTIDFFIFSIPIYNISLSFILKFIIFDLSMCTISINLFIKRRYYGFPYPEFLCPPFAIISVCNTTFAIYNIFYFIIGEMGINQFIRNIRELLILANKENIFNIYTIDYTALYPAIPFVVLNIASTILALLLDKTSFSLNIPIMNKSNSAIFWKRNLILPGEEDYDNERNYLCRRGNVFICFVVIYRFICLMNIKLSYLEIVGIFMGMLILFYFYEHENYKTQMDKDLLRLYEIAADQLHFKDGGHLNDLVDFALLRIEELSKISMDYERDKVRNIRWLELYEHMVVNDAKSIYDAVANWEDGIYSTEKTMEEIKPKISSIERISVDCIPILPGSRNFKPKEIDIISYFQNSAFIKGDFQNNGIESYIVMADLSNLEAILHTITNYFASISEGQLTCIVQEGFSNVIIELISGDLNDDNILLVQRNIKTVNNFWDGKQIIDYYNFPIELAIARVHMKDINGDLLTKVENNKLKFDLLFPNAATKSNYLGHEVENEPIELGYFLSCYANQNQIYIHDHWQRLCEKTKVFILTDKVLLTEVLDNFIQYAAKRKNMMLEQFVEVSVKEREDKVYISLKFWYDDEYYPVALEVQESLNYWQLASAQIPKHTSLSLLMMKTKMDKLAGDMKISLDDTANFYCDLIFKKYKPEGVNEKAVN